jgi:hypothetical protein
MQLVDEEWWFGIHKKLDLAAAASRPGSDSRRSPGDKCTVIGVSRSRHGPSMVAQNMDIPGYADGNMVLLRVRQPESDLQALVLTYAGLICLNGVNSAGIGVCLNTLLDLKPSPEGLPVAYANRGVLAQASFVGAERFLRDITIASGQCYNLGGKEQVKSLECSAGKVVQHAAGQRAFVHTNHALASEDWSRFAELQRRRRAAQSQPAGNSQRRLAAAEKHLLEAGEQVTVQTIKAALSSHDDARNPICCHHDTREQGYTAAATIFVLSDRPRMHVSAGPPCKTAFAEHGF